MSSSQVPLRAAVRSMPAYVPGARSGEGGPVVAKLSSNENPFPPHPAVVAAVEAAARQVNRYPDMYARDLVEALASLHRWPEAGVVVGNGSVAVLSHVLEAVCETGDEVVFPWRSFEAYPIAVAVRGATGVPVPLTTGARHDLAAMAAAVSPRTRAVLLCSPNNPTGPALTHEEVRGFMTQVPPDVLVVLDEAYADFVREPAAVDGPALLAERPNVVVLRTFSKAYALAGLRVGYALTAPRLGEGIRAVSTPFGVNALAQAAALAALDVRDDLLAVVADLVAERERVVAGLAAQGRLLPDAQGNFVWLDLGDAATEFAGHARQAGVLVRPFTGEGARVTIGSPAENDAFLNVAREWA